jgi:hypothetical protein
MKMSTGHSVALGNQSPGHLVEGHSVAWALSRRALSRSALSRCAIKIEKTEGKSKLENYKEAQLIFSFRRRMAYFGEHFCGPFAKVI